MEKNELLTLHCSRLGSELEGVCTHDGMTVFVAGALPGETIEAQVLKVHSSYAFAKLRRIVEASPFRQTPPCPVYEKCGGCSGQHMTYEATLQAKRAQVFDCLTRIGGLSLTEEDVPPVLGADHPWHCRNKTALPVGGTSRQPELGFYRRRSHQIVPIEDCPVTMGKLSPMIGAVSQWMQLTRVQPYDELRGTGLLRHVILRRSRSGESMVLLVSTSPKLPRTELLVQLLKDTLPGFCALHLSVNKARNNVILGKDSLCLYGSEAIYETLLGHRFEIAPLSFFQVNPDQTERLYQCAIELARLKPEHVVVDAYAGAGTISLCMAPHVKKVIGIEIVPQAIEAAKRNAAAAGITNAEFYTAAVEDLLPVLVKDGLQPDVIMLDPPRKGVEQPVIDAVLQARPRRVVYVSCHVPTQARDIKLLCEGGYQFEACQPVDMFCWAGGIENIVQLVLP